MSYIIKKNDENLTIIKTKEYLSLLNFHHPHISIPYFDETTKEIVQQFQIQYGLKATGNIDCLTWDKIMMKIKQKYQNKIELKSNSHHLLCYRDQGLAIEKNTRIFKPLST